MCAIVRVVKQVERVYEMITQEQQDQIAEAFADLEQFNDFDESDDYRERYENRGQ